MSETECEALLKDLIENVASLDSEEAAELGLMPDILCAEAPTFEESGLPTRTRGLLLRTRDGSEFHLTITRSK